MLLCFLFGDVVKAAKESNCIAPQSPSMPISLTRSYLSLPVTMSTGGRAPIYRCPPPMSPVRRDDSRSIPSPPLVRWATSNPILYLGGAPRIQGILHCQERRP